VNYYYIASCSTFYYYFNILITSISCC